VKSRYFYGYNIVAAGFTIQAVCIGAMFAYGVFFKELQAEFGWSRAIISGASSLAFLIMGAVGILAGRLNDRIGPRRVFHRGVTHGGGVVRYRIARYAVRHHFVQRNPGRRVWPRDGRPGLRCNRKLPVGISGADRADTDRFCVDCFAASNQSPSDPPLGP